MGEIDKNKYRRLYRIRSFSDPDKEYIIGERKDGKWTCTCPAFVYRRGRKYELPDGQKVCKHIAHLYYNQRQYVPYWDADKKEYEQLMQYSVNYVKDEYLDARVMSIAEHGAVAIENSKEEDIMLFAEDYARLNIPASKKKEGLEM